MARWSGMLALALSGLAVSARADSTYEDAFSNENSNGNFESPATASQLRDYGVRHKAGICCRSGISAYEPTFEDFSLVPESQLSGFSKSGITAQAGTFSVRSRHEELAVSTNDPVDASGPAVLGSSVSAGASFVSEDALSNWYGNAIGNFGLSANGSSLDNGHESVAVGLPGMRANNPSLEDSLFVRYPQPSGLDENGNTPGTGKVGGPSGHNGSQAPRNAPLEVSEPALLALLATGLAAAGLLVLKREAQIADVEIPEGTQGCVFGAPLFLSCAASGGWRKLGSIHLADYRRGAPGS